MTYTPGRWYSPPKQPVQDLAALRRQDHAHGNLKQSHVRHVQHKSRTIPATVTSATFDGIAEHDFLVSVLMDDGSVRSFDHRARRELYLEDICARFSRGTLILTDQGPASIEDLRPGHSVQTRDNGPQVIRWIGSCSFPEQNRTDADDTQAIRIKSDALGELRPLQDLVVSARFRMLTNHPSCAALFGSPETLAPAIDLLDGETILPAQPSPQLEFYNLMLDNHQIITANGLETESYHPGNFGVSVMSLELQSHLRQLFVHLDHDLGGFGRSVRPILKGFEAEILRVG